MATANHIPEKPFTILVTDDDALNREIARMNLTHAGYAVCSASNGREALSLCQRESIDLVLLDIVMPEMDGFETARRLRQLPQGTDIPIVFITALNDLGTHQRAIDEEIDDFLTKPFDLTEMVIRVRSLLRIKKLTGEARAASEAIRAQRDELILIQQQRRELIDLVVHDLKSPLSSISSNLQYLRRQNGLSLEASEAVEDAFSATKTTLDMLLNILDVSRSEDGALVPRVERVDLVTLLSKLERTLKVRFDAHEQTLRTQVDPNAALVYGDADLIRRILENLLDNAMRYSPRNAAIDLEVQAAHGGFVEFRIRDSGPGIPDHFKNKIFEKYLQLRSDSNGRRGTHGLGLLFCRKATEAHGGLIWVEDNRPEGSCFCVRLPAKLSYTPTVDPQRQTAQLLS
jgi:signal transduction histidine kinase